MDQNRESPGSTERVDRSEIGLNLPNWTLIVLAITQLHIQYILQE